MKRYIKYILIPLGSIISFIILMIFFDIINAKLFKTSPIISRYESFGDYGYVDRGIIFDVFYCNNSADVIFVSWKLNGSKYTCPEIEYEPMVNIIDNVFVKTYTIDNIEISDKIGFQKWTVSNISEENSETVEVFVSSFKVEKGKKYEIIFRIKNNKIENNIKSIFENSEIENIKETNKDINQFIR